MTDYNLIQMRYLLNKENVTVVYLHAAGDYWVRQQEFCDAFRAVPLTDDIVIHVQFEGLSLTHSLVVPAIEKIIEETGRDNNSVYIFSPNALFSDAKWTNIFWRCFKVSDEFSRSATYWSSSPPVDDNFKTWALFVGRRTTPRLLALYDIWNDEVLRDKCLLSVMEHPMPEEIQIFDCADKPYDQLDNWMPLPTVDKLRRIFQHNKFREFCRDLPLGSIDGYSLTDQYTDSTHGENRNSNPTISLINFGGKYLFELTFETMTRGFTFTPSEKTIRTIVAEKPLIVYAPKHFLENMKKIGFKTFDNLWDEDYDQLEGPERYWAMMKIVKEISSLSKADQLALYQASRDTCAHNRELLRQYSINNRVDYKPAQLMSKKHLSSVLINQINNNGDQ